MMVAILQKMKLIQHYTLPVKQDRVLVLFLISGIYVALAFFLHSKGNILNTVSNLFFIFIVHIFGLALISIYFKISIHVSSIAAVFSILMVLIFKFSLSVLLLPALIILLILGLVSSSRLELEAHSLSEIGAGAVWGVFSGLFAFLIF
jgi:hypothetical protein